jgi:hypothetical protein
MSGRVFCRRRTTIIPRQIRFGPYNKQRSAAEGLAEELRTGAGVKRRYIGCEPPISALRSEMIGAVQILF